MMDVERKENNRHTIEHLMVACDTNDFEMCHKILKSNPQLINTPYPKIANWLNASPYNPGATVIHYASRSGHYNMAYVLMKEYNANIHVTDRQNWNTLHYACNSGHYLITELFIENHVDQNKITKYEKCSPLQFAEYKKWNDIIHLFKTNTDAIEISQHQYSLKEKQGIFDKTTKRLDKLIKPSSNPTNALTDIRLCRYYKPFQPTSCRDGAQCRYTHLDVKLKKNMYNKHGATVKLDLYLHRYEINLEVFLKLRENLCQNNTGTLVFKCIDVQLKQLHPETDGRIWFIIYHNRSIMHEQRKSFEAVAGIKVIRSGSISRLDHILVLRVDDDDDNKMMKLCTNTIGDAVDMVGMYFVDDNDEHMNDIEHKSDDTQHENKHNKQFEITWNQHLNIPHIDTIMQHLNEKKLLVGFENMDKMYSGEILANYSLYDNIPTQHKLQLMKQCMERNPSLDRAIACMYGMGIGDATGAPLEFIDCVRFYKKSYFSLKNKKWVKEYNKFGLKRGQFTDDASMGLCIADSLIQCKEFNGSDIRIRFWNWWNNGLCNTFRYDSERSDKSSVGLGNNISKSLYSMKHNVAPSDAFISRANKDDSGNGSLMRLAAIPVFYSCCGNIDIALQFAKHSSYTTHQGCIAAEACALMTFIVIHAIHRSGKEKIKAFLNRITKEYLEKISKEYAALVENKDKKHDDKTLQRNLFAKECIIKLLNAKEAKKSKERCWNWRNKYGKLGIAETMINRGSNYNGYPNSQGYFGSFCMDGISMGLHSAYNSHSFGEAIENAVNLLGDADSTGSIAGQIAGAFYGFKDVVYDTKSQRFLFEQITKWDQYDFGLRAVLLYCIGKTKFN